MRQLITAAGLCASLFLAHAAQATLAVTATDNGTPIALTVNQANGNLTATGTDANFSAIGITATGAPAVPAPALGTVTLDVHSIASATNVLDITVTQTGLNTPAGFQSATDNTFNGLIGAPGPITQNMFIDGSLLNTVTFPASSGTATQDFTDLITVPITSDAEEFAMTFTGPQAALETIAFVAAPSGVSEPGSLALLGAGLLLLGTLRLRSSRSSCG
jgi:hypothetical protein